MDEASFLQSVDEEVVLQHWASLGSLTVDSNTKMYRRGSIIRVKCVNAQSELHNQILYVAEDYTVNGVRVQPIKWDEVAVDDVTGMYIASEGIQSPYFIVLNARWIDTFTANPDFIPFQGGEGVSVNNGGVTITDDALELLLADVGFPFLTFQDVEFAKNEIERVCIKPAIERFYTFFPIIDEQPGSLYSRGSEFLVPFPEGAYACVPYYTTPGGVSASQASNNPFSYYNELQVSGAMGGGGRFGRGVHYYGKQTPGFVGMEWRNTQLDRMATAQSFLNYYRREKCRRVKIDGKWFAKGFSSVGGNLNFKWLKLSYDWDDIPLELLEPVARPMAKSAVLQQFGMLRQLVKTDIAGALDATVLTNERKTIEENLKPILTSVATAGTLSIMRGGG